MPSVIIFSLFLCKYVGLCAISCQLHNLCMRLYSCIHVCITYACMYLLYCIALYCIALYCIALYCIVLYCTVLYCTVLYCIVLYCILFFHLYNFSQPQPFKPTITNF